MSSDLLRSRAAQMLFEAKRVVCFSGAGLSAESGVPTFRDSHAVSGALWAKYDPMTLASPEGFARDPQAVIEWYNWRRRTIAVAQPNAAHRALANAQSLFGDGLINVTQNVDDLLHRAGAKKVIQLHGSIAVDRCHSDCGCQEEVSLADPPPRRTCSECGGAMRPGVVWFGEALPTEAWNAAERAVMNCEALLVVGTSAVVYPAAGLISMARSAGAKIIVVNTHPSGASALADVELLGPAAEVLPQLLSDQTR